MCFEYCGGSMSIINLLFASDGHGGHDWEAEAGQTGDQTPSPGKYHQWFN